MGDRAATLLRRPRRGPSAEFVRDDAASTAHTAARTPNSLVLRPSSQARGWPGCASGYAVGPVPLLDAVRSCGRSLSVRGPPQRDGARGAATMRRAARQGRRARERSGRSRRRCAQQAGRFRLSQGIVWLRGDRTSGRGGVGRGRHHPPRRVPPEGIRVSRSGEGVFATHSESAARLFRTLTRAPPGVVESCVHGDTSSCWQPTVAVRCDATEGPAISMRSRNDRCASFYRVHVLARFRASSRTPAAAGRASSCGYYRDRDSEASPGRFWLCPKRTQDPIFRSARTRVGNIAA